MRGGAWRAIESGAKSLPLFGVRISVEICVEFVLGRWRRAVNNSSKHGTPDIIKIKEVD